jgi:hypothetical protein
MDIETHDSSSDSEYDLNQKIEDLVDYVKTLQLPVDAKTQMFIINCLALFYCGGYPEDDIREVFFVTVTESQIDKEVSDIKNYIMYNFDEAEIAGSDFGEILKQCFEKSS